MNRGPWEEQGYSSNSNWRRGSSGGARPKNGSSGAQGTSYQKTYQSGQPARGRRMPIPVLTSSRETKGGNVSQHNVDQGEKPKNPWKQVAPTNSKVSVDLNLLEAGMNVNSMAKNQKTFAGNDSRSGYREATVLNFTILSKLANPDAEASDIARKFTEKNAFAEFIDSASPDCLELVIVALGQFCEKNGPTIFHNAFIKIVTALGEKNIFAQIPNLIMQLPRSRAANLGSKEDRLARLITSIARLITEMLTVAPAFSCNVLGKDFAEDVYAMSNIPSVRNLTTSNIFDALLDVKERLQCVWEQHSKAGKTQHTTDNRAALRAFREEQLSSMEPPDDFRMLNVMPNSEDLYQYQEPFLRPNKVRGGYRDVDTYLDTQFRLLREDFFRPLREGLVAYRENVVKSKSKNHVRIDNIRIYQDVKIKDYDVKTNSYTIEFSVRHLKRINWEGSKRLIYGSLLLLSVDHFDTFLLFTVADRKPDLLAKGTLKAYFEGEALPGYAMKEILVMAESAVFFEAYRSVLVALQRVSPAHFPLQDHILCKTVEPSPPKYLESAEMPVYDLRPVRSDFSSKKNAMPNHVEQRLSGVSILDPYARPQYDLLGLDPSQSEALYAALTRKVVVIQGPPGTGKTYLGLKIVQTLLQNKQRWAEASKRPILAICYTNHALDQFLEGMLKFTERIVRVGSQSKCEALERFNLRELKKQSLLTKKNSPHRRWFFEVRLQLADFRRVWLKYKNVYQYAEKSAVIHEDSLLNLGIISREIHDKIKSAARFEPSQTPLSTNSALVKWLRANSIGMLQEIIAVAQKNGSFGDLNAQYAAEANDAEPPAEEEEWEKEDIDDIQGQRMQNDDIYQRIYSPDESNILNDISGLEDPHLSFSFAFTIGSVKLIKEELEVLRPQLEGEDVEIATRQINMMERLIEYFPRAMEATQPMDRNGQAVLEMNEDFRRIPFANRWKMYACWRNQVQKMLAKRIFEKEKLYRQTENELKDVDTLDTAEMIRDFDIVGITTTAAAKQRALLEHLKPKIVIVEEAAEVLEAHIVTSLSASCQHLILIGDHQQLRPSNTVFELAKDYHLDVSLFERLILNGLRPCVLSVQHRMRPEVARLIVPSIYPHLENHQSVLEYPEIRGVNHSVFFLEHSEREIGDSSDADSRSRVNPYEAEMALALAKHLLLQGYEPSKITILTTYSGQLFHLRKLRRQMGLLQNVRVTVVDNFQGEENDVIILSLVRSNEDGNIGFLRIDNRICVALSRAKQGFYLIGNMASLENKSKVWRQIQQVLNAHGQIGRKLVLRCEIHDVFIDAARAVDFPPEGGCFNKCLQEMPCKHICPRICHAEDREHLSVKCLQKCTRSCPVGHPCPKLCYQDCHPCLTNVFKVLPCSHSQKMACYKDPESEFCLTKVIKKLPICGHEKEMDCGRDPAVEKCVELCGMLLNCQHHCNQPCHKKSSHEKLPCTQPCMRTCPANHPCPKKCFEDCGNCLVDVRKKLPCGHEGNLKCWILPKDAYCNVKIQKGLPNCLHTAELECSASAEQYRCTQKCGKLLCSDGHICQKRCSENCGNCFARVERLLECGHSAKVECYVNPKNIRCKTPRSVVLPGCGHRVDVPCSEGEKAKCPMPCDVRLDCGHQCTRTCHAFDDPEHANYECNKPCGRKRKGCRLDHKCSKKCKEECDPCNVKASRVLPCGHSAFVECGMDDNQVYCSKPVTKQIECGHTMKTACSANPSRKSCREPCQSILTCGHRCVNKCNEVCDASHCTELVKLNSQALCGHKLSVPCNRYRQNLFSQDDMASFLLGCPEPCNAILPCEHPCNGTCGGCLNGRLHQTCKEKCGRSLICGHNCDVDCASSCPPCKKKCEYRCMHSKCSKTCSEPCSECMEPCNWKCPHHKCSRKCGEICNRPVCNQPCREILSCGHPCVGLCGEICPPLCRVCNKEQLTEFMLFGYEEDDDARFIYLEDCKHCIEVNGLDHWMKMEQDTVETAEIQMKRCPRCKTIIRSSYRYGNVLKRTLKDIALVKEKLMNARSNSKQFGDDLQLKIAKASKANAALKKELNHVINQLIDEGLARIKDAISPKKKQNKLIYPCIDDDTRYMLQVQVDVLEAVLAMLQNAAKVKQNSANNQAFPTLTASVSKISVDMKPTLLQDILDRTARVVTLLLDRNRLATQDHQAYQDEVVRLDLLRAFYILKSTPAYDSHSRTTLHQQSIQLDEILLKNVKRIDEPGKTTIKGLLDIMAARLNTGLGISDRERREIVQALGMRPGHWYKCPNGHIYVITECGGAMQEGTCNECGARIGGGSHRLRADNSLAGEMDGARYAAWGDVANNMGNFRLDF